MATIRTYEVTVPPTSGEVEILALDAMRDHTLLPITGTPEASDIGPRDNVTLEVRIRSTFHPQDGSMRILGETVLGETVNMQLSPEPENPANFTMIFDF